MFIKVYVNEKEKVGTGVKFLGLLSSPDGRMPETINLGKACPDKGERQLNKYKIICQDLEGKAKDFIVYVTADNTREAINKAIDNFGILTFGIDKEGNFYIFDVYRNRLSYGEQESFLINNFICEEVIND